MITVIRIIKYEGPEERIREMIAKSKQLGVHEYADLTMTVAEHFSDLPPDPILTIDNEELHASLAKAQLKVAE